MYAGLYSVGNSVAPQGRTVGGAQAQSNAHSLHPSNKYSSVTNPKGTRLPFSTICHLLRHAPLPLSILGVIRSFPPPPSVP